MIVMKKKSNNLENLKLDSKINRFTNIKQIEIIFLFYEGLYNKEDFERLYLYAKNKRYSNSHFKNNSLLLEFGTAVLIKTSSYDFAIKLLLDKEDIDVSDCIELLYKLNEQGILINNNEEIFYPRRLFYEISKNDISVLKEITTYFTQENNVDVLNALITNYFSLEFIKMIEENKNSNFYQHYSIGEIISFIKISANYNMAMHVLNLYLESVIACGIDTLPTYQLHNILFIVFTKKYYMQDTNRVDIEGMKIINLLEQLSKSDDVDKNIKEKIFKDIIYYIKLTRNSIFACRLSSIFPELSDSLKKLTK